MNAIKRYWIDFAAWVKGRNRLTPLGLGHTGRRLRLIPVGWDKPQTSPLIPVESWAERKAAFDRAQKSHHGRGEAAAQLRRATNAKLIEGVFEDDTAPARLVDTHPWLFRDPDAFVAAVKATARRRVQEARR